MFSSSFLFSTRFPFLFMIHCSKNFRKKRLPWIRSIDGKPSVRSQRQIKQTTSVEGKSGSITYQLRNYSKNIDPGLQQFQIRTNHSKNHVPPLHAPRIKLIPEAVTAKETPPSTVIELVVPARVPRPPPLGHALIATPVVSHHRCGPRNFPLLHPQYHVEKVW